MTRTSIKKILLTATNGAGLINRQRIKRALGWGNPRVDELTRGLDFVRLKRTKLYDVDEVAARVYLQVEKA